MLVNVTLHREKKQKEKKKQQPLLTISLYNGKFVSFSANSFTTNG